MNVDTANPLEVAAHIATAIAAVVAVTALVFTYFQWKRTIHEQRLGAAKALYKEYLQLAMANPDLAEPDLDALRQDPAAFHRYEWFVSYLLLACEEVLANAPKWSNVVHTQLGFHTDYLRTLTSEFRSHYDDRLVRLLPEFTT